MCGEDIIAILELGAVVAEPPPAFVGVAREEMGGASTILGVRFPVHTPWTSKPQKFYTTPTRSLPLHLRPTATVRVAKGHARTRSVTKAEGGQRPSPIPP